MKVLRGFLVIGVFLLLGYMAWPYYGGFVIRKAYPVFQIYEKKQLDRYTTNDLVQKQGNVQLYYRIEDQEYVSQVLQLAQEAFGILNGYFPSHIEHVDIILYPSLHSLQQQLRISPGADVLGAYYGKRINVLSPRAWKVGDRFSCGQDQLKNTVLHEMAHMFVDVLAQGNFPLWFTEGTALYIEYDTLDYEWAANVPMKKLFPVDELDARLNSKDGNLAYRQSFLMVRKLVETGGKKKLLDLIKEAGQGISFDNSVKNIYGYNIRQLGDRLQVELNAQK